METSAVPLLAEKQQSSAKLFSLSPAEALERRAEFEPQIREVYDGYHVPEKTYMKGPTRRRVPGLCCSYRDDDNFIVYYYQFDCVVATFYTIMLAYLNNNNNDIYYLSEFYAWAYWCDTGSTKLPQGIIDKADEAELLREKRDAEQRQKREAEEATRQEEMRQFGIELFSRYFYADDVKSGKVPFDRDKMADCLAFREIVADVRELALADYFHYEIYYKLSDQQPIYILFCTLIKATELEDDGKVCFANAWDKDGHFDLNCIKQGELNREQLKLEAEKARQTNQGKTIPEQFARKQFDCFCKGIPFPTYCEIQGKQIEWIANTKKIATAWGEEESEETEHLIQWGEDQYKRQDFFAAAYPGQYNRVKRRVNFLGVYENDVLRLTTSQRTKLMYNILAYKYRDCLVPVDKADENTLKVLCDEERNNPTASDLLSRLRWTNGLSKLVTFGVGMKAGGAAKYTWCYTVDFSGNSAKYYGADMTWEIWGSNLTFILDNYNEPLPPSKSEDLETVFRRTLYF